MSKVNKFFSVLRRQNKQKIREQQMSYENRINRQKSIKRHSDNTFEKLRQIREDLEKMKRQDDEMLHTLGYERDRSTLDITSPVYNSNLEERNFIPRNSLDVKLRPRNSLNVNLLPRNSEAYSSCSSLNKLKIAKTVSSLDIPSRPNSPNFYNTVPRTQHVRNRKINEIQNINSQMHVMSGIARSAGNFRQVGSIEECSERMNSFL